MAQLLTNNAVSTILTGIASGALSVQVAAGEGAKFPSPTGGDFFLVTLFKSTAGTDTAIEIVKCTARSADVLTIVRAQEGTTANAYLAGDFIALRITAGSFQTDAVTEGATNKYFTEPRVLASLMAGLSTATSTAATAADSILVAVGKLQAQVTSRALTADKDATGGYAGLTGYALTLKNASGAFASTLGHSATAARAWTLPDKNGIVAMTSDIVAYSLPVSSASVLGGIKVGANLSIDGAGVLSAAASGTGTVTSVNSVSPSSGNVTLATANVPEATNLYFTEPRVLASVLTGLSTVTNAAISAADSVLIACGKLQKQITDLLAGKDTTGGYPGLTLFKLNLRNAANTVTSFFTNANTVSRTYTLQDRDGTIADNTDLVLKASLSGAAFTGAVSGITKTMVGLASVDNTADTAKPVSTFQQTALNLKADAAGAILTGVTTIMRASVTQLVETKTVITQTTSGTVALDLSTKGGYRLNMQASPVTLTFNSPPAGGDFFGFTLMVVNDATAGRVLNFPTYKSANGAPPARTTTANAIDWWYFWTDDAGSTWHGTLSQADSR